jgi:signal-transduction protein with cAMP-binding, CBS, and nucleotidyltransferase domain
MESVRDVMSSELVTLDAAAPIRRAAELMHERDVGDVIITKDGELFGIVTDRDIVIRAVAVDADCEAAVSTVCTSNHMVTVSAEDNLDKARDRMRRKAVRRVIVVEDGAPIGVVSLGDLAIEREPRSILGRISAAPPNN